MTFTEAHLVDAVLDRLSECPNPRFKTIMTAPILRSRSTCFIISFLDPIFLKILGYSGKYFDWRVSPSNERSATWSDCLWPLCTGAGRGGRTSVFNQLRCVLMAPHGSASCGIVSAARQYFNEFAPWFLPVCEQC